MSSSMLQVFCAGLIISLSSSPALGQRRTQLPSKAKSHLNKTMGRYVRAGEDERAALLPELLIHGLPGIEYLRTLKKKKGYREPVSDVVVASKKLLGVDLLEGAGSVATEREFGPSYFGFDEIVLLRTKDRFAGFALRSDLNPDEGRIHVTWWGQPLKGPRKLTQPGGEKGESTITGTKAAKFIKPNAGYTEHDFAFEVYGIPVSIRWVGPAHFLHRYGGEAAWALTGEENPARLSSADKRIRYFSAFPSDLARLQELLPRYLFRVVPGAEPLPLDEAEKADFAQYEQVQVLVRVTRPEGFPVVLVKFLEPDNVEFSDYHAAYLLNFSNELADVAEDRMIIMGGNSPGLEGNRFWLSGRGWSKPPKKVVELLRRNFPEAY